MRPDPDKTILFSSDRFRNRISAPMGFRAVAADASASVTKKRHSADNIR